MPNKVISCWLTALTGIHVNTAGYVWSECEVKITDGPNRIGSVIYTLQRKCSNSVIKGSYPEQIISLYGLVWFNLNCWAAYLVIYLLFLSACLCLCIPYRLSVRQIYPAAEPYVTAVSKYHSQYGGQSWETPNLTASLTLANSPRVYRLRLNFLLYLILLFKNCCHDCSSADGLVAGIFQWLFLPVVKPV